jgi:hypothetical protein
MYKIRINLPDLRHNAEFRKYQIYIDLSDDQVVQILGSSTVAYLPLVKFVSLWHQLAFFDAYRVTLAALLL